MKYKEEIETLAIIILVVLDVWGWWATLFLWTIPTASVPIGTMTTIALIAVILFFTGWLAAMIYGLFILIVILLGVLQ